VSAGSQPLGRLERHLGRLLIAGVVVSAALLAAGLGLWLAAPGHSATIWLLNAGLIALIKPLELDAATRYLHLPAALAATLVLCATLRLRGGLTRIAGIAFLGLYVAYIVAAIAAG